MDFPRKHDEDLHSNLVGALEPWNLMTFHSIYPSSSKGRRKLGLSSKTLFYFESLFCSYPVFEGRFSQPMDHTIYSSFQPCIFELYYYGFQGTKKNGTSKQRTHLLDSKILKTYVLFHGHFMALSCHGWLAFFPC